MRVIENKYRGKKKVRDLKEESSIRKKGGVSEIKVTFFEGSGRCIKKSGILSEMWRLVQKGGVS